MNLNLDLLNTEQQKAVQHTEGPCLVIAGPGSGKTRVLTYRIAYLIQEKGVTPSRIMVFTFTKKAAQEIVTRLETMLDKQAKLVWVGTFHGLFSRILRREASFLGFTSDFSIYDTEDSKRLISRMRKELALPEKSYKAAYILARIGHAKRNFMDANLYAKNSDWRDEDESNRMPALYEVYAHYQARCQKANAMDFDDLLWHTNQLFQTNQKVLEKYQQWFHYLLVDEFQDTDMMQYAILQKMTAVHKNLCVIGDDAQSIYSFRGANVDNILSFQKHFPTCTLFRLEENYRATKYLVKAANTLMQHNQQHPKTLFTNNEQGVPIPLFSRFNEEDEARFVTRSLLEAHEKNQVPYNEVAVLYRNNNQSRLLEESLLRNNIPYRIVGSLPFYKRKEIKDFLAYLHLIVNPDNEEALTRAINEPKRNIGAVTLQRLREHALQKGISIWESIRTVKEWMKGRAADSIYTFAQLIESQRTLLPTEEAYTIAARVARQSGLMVSAIDSVTLDDEAKNRYEHMEEMLESIKNFCVHNPAKASLLDFLEEISLFGEDEHKVESSDRPKVSLMTVHKAKGLEFACVYIVGVEEGIFPSSFAITGNNEAMEEERRLFFVAMTRAKKKLILTCTEQRHMYGNIVASAPSRFLNELDPTCLVTEPGLSLKKNGFKTERGTFGKKTPATQPTRTGAQLQIGAYLNHPTFGKGVIQKVEPSGAYQRVVINFPQVGPKTLLLKQKRS